MQRATTTPLCRQHESSGKEQHAGYTLWCTARKAHDTQSSTGELSFLPPSPGSHPSPSPGSRPAGWSPGGPSQHGRPPPQLPGDPQYHLLWVPRAPLSTPSSLDPAQSPPRLLSSVPAASWASPSPLRKEESVTWNLRESAVSQFLICSGRNPICLSSFQHTVVTP